MNTFSFACTYSLTCAKRSIWHLSIFTLKHIPWMTYISWMTYVFFLKKMLAKVSCALSVQFTVHIVTSIFSVLALNASGIFWNNATFEQRAKIHVTSIYVHTFPCKFMYIHCFLPAVVSSNTNQFFVVMTQATSPLTTSTVKFYKISDFSIN